MNDINNQANYPQQQTPQPIPPQASEQPRYHVHHSYVWLGSIYTFISLFIAFVFVVGPTIFGAELAGFSGSFLVSAGAIVLFVLVVALVFGFMYLSWKNLYYELGENEFSFYSGILYKKKIHVPYQRIQAVNQRAGLVQRLFGVCSVEIDTAGGSVNKAIRVPYIQNYMAEWLRVELFARKQFILNGQLPQQAATTTGAQIAQQGTNVLDAPAEVLNDVRGIFGGSEVGSGAVSYEYGLGNKELFFTGLSNSTGVALAIVAVIAPLFAGISGFLESSIGRFIYQEGLAFVTNAFADRLIWLIVGSIVAFIALTWIASIVGTCISYGGFKARRRGTRIEIEHGLLQHRFHGVDIDRVQSVIIKQSLTRRLIGYCELSLGKIDATAGSSQDQENSMKINQGLVVHPFVKMSKVPEILSGLVPEFADVPTEQIALPKVSLRRALIRRVILHGSGVWLALAAAILQVSLNTFGPMDEAGFASFIGILNMSSIAVYALCLIIVVVEFVGAIMWFRGSSFAYNRRFMQITNGGYSRESVSFPRKKIQFGSTRTNPLQRNSHVATIAARTAAGLQGTTIRLLDVDEQEAQKWLNWVKPGQSGVQ